MLITLHRHHHTRWGVDGTISINGEHIADTTEHPTAHLPEGIYTLTRKRMLFRRGNGPMLNTDGSICVGERLCDGCVLRTSEIYHPLRDRIRKTLSRGKHVTLIIKCFLIALVLTGCSTTRSVVVRQATHDTLYLSQVQYDSIFIDRYQTSSAINDTVYLESIRYEYKYKFLHDTIRQSHIDSIPVIHEVEVVKTERHIPGIYRASLWVCIGLIILIILFVLLKIFLK